MVFVEIPDNGELGEIIFVRDIAVMVSQKSIVTISKRIKYCQRTFRARQRHQMEYGLGGM